MITVCIDGKPVSVPEGATILDAARAAGIEIPTLCHLPGKPAMTSCLVCVVRIDGGNRLLPSCATAVREGMRIDSSSPEVHAARRTALELLLGYHLGDCLAPCESICPTHYDIPKMLRLAKAWRLEEAIAVMLEHCALPAVLARVCTRPCERGCRRHGADGSVAVGEVERFVTDADLALPHLPACHPDSGRRVVIVGAGPVGLAAAYHLRRLGHACSVVEAAATAGGSLRAIADLPAAVLEAEIRRIQRLGAVFHFGSRVDAANLAELAARFDTVLLATGDHLASDRTNVVAAEVPRIADVVHAVAAGRNAAMAIAARFADREPPAKRPWSIHIGRTTPEQLATFLACASPSPRHDGRLDVDAAKGEGARCLACACASRDTCHLRRWAAAYGANAQHHHVGTPPLLRDDSHPLVTYETAKCIACGLCVQVAAEHGERLGLGFAGRGFAVRVAVPLGGNLREALATSAEACAAACPTGAIALRITAQSSRMASPIIPSQLGCSLSAQGASPPLPPTHPSSESPDEPGIPTRGAL